MGTTDLTAATSILRYWLDIEALTPPSVESEEGVIRVDDRTPDINWTMGLPDDRQQRTVNIVHIGLFNREFAAQDIARRLAVAEDEDFDVAPADRRQGFLAAFRVGPDGKTAKGSLKTSLFALRYETLGNAGPPSSAELAERKIALSEGFDENWCGDTAPPVDTCTLKDILKWLCDRLKATPALQEQPFAIVRQWECGNEDDDDLMGIVHSFLYEDLYGIHQAAISGRLSPPLSNYLTPEDRPADERWDADNLAEVVDRFTVPGLMPAGKWPSRGMQGHPLALRQQMAVNATIDLLRHGGLFSVNGPPGTGKSTLLRDIVAAVIVERAEAMSRFGEPNEAFTKEEAIPIGNRMAPVWALNQSLCDHGILVCSNNNTAVENITKELPDVRALAASYQKNSVFLDHIAFFRDVAQAVAGESQKVWGLVSAALGKSSNRSAFIGNYWPKDDNSRIEMLCDVRIFKMEEPTQTRLENTRVVARVGHEANELTRVKAFGAPADALAHHYDDVKKGEEVVLTLLGTFEVEEFQGRDGETKIDRFYKVITVDPPPTSAGIRDIILHGAGRCDWAKAVEEFRVARGNVAELVEMTETLRVAPREIEGLAQAARVAREEAATQEIRLVEKQQQNDRTRAEADCCERRYQEALQHSALLLASRPSWFRWSAAREWKKRAETLERTLDEAKHERDRAKEDGRVSEDDHAFAVQKFKELTERTKELEQRLAAMKERLAEAQGAFRTAPLTFDELAGKDREDRERSAVWVSEELDLARERLFAAALRVHLAFLSAAGDRVCDNLRLFVDVLRGDRELRAVRAKIGRHLWNTFFMTVPVISSTFASVGPMFEHDLGSGDLGWLLIEEGGQAMPQAAVGALWRAKRALVVGDPKQIEPVVTIPREVSALLRRQYGDIDHQFDASMRSVQSVSDRRNRLGAYIGGKERGIWVGCPLRVHYRCNDPMFSISNAISYDRSMVLFKPKLDTSGWAGTIPEYGPGGHRSAWFDVRYEANASGNWVPSQTAIALRMLMRMVEQRQAAEGLTNGKGESLRSLYLRDDGMPAAFVISPFRSVALAMRKEIRKHVDTFRRFDSRIDDKTARDWARTHIGTVHTFQGKEAETVILVLGGTTQRPQAVAWAGRTANILNVAVTRAKTSLYVVGHQRLWRQRSSYFDTACAAAGDQLPTVELPDFVAAAPDPERIERIDKLDGHLSVLRHALESAKTRVVISSPYLSDRTLHDRRCNVTDLIRQATGRNVKVSIFIDLSLSTQTSWQEKSFLRGKEALIEAGAEVILVGRVHAKTLCVDDREIAEGSFNWLSAVRNETSRYSRLECSFRYTGRKTGCFIAQAISLLAEHRIEEV